MHPFIQQIYVYRIRLPPILARHDINIIKITNPI